MNNFRRTAIASIINLTLLGAGNVYAGDTSALEKRIRELEKRLEQLDKASVLPSEVVTTTPPTVTPEVEKLTRKVNTLERKLEVQDEVTTGNFKKQPVIDAGADGFKITSADKKHQVRIRGAVQTDARFFLDNNANAKSLNTANQEGPDRFELKQGRVWLEGYVYNDIYFKIMPDFAASGNILPDAYLDYAYHPAASLLVGKFKSPLSLERLQGDSDTVFMERAFPTYLASNRDVGLQFHGALSKPGYKTDTVAGPIDAKNTLTYQIGVSNGTGDSGSPNNDAKDTDSNKEVNARLFGHPFQHTGYSWLEGLGLGVAGSFGDPNQQAVNNLNTPNGASRYLDYTKNKSTNPGITTSNGATYRVYPQAYWYAGPIGLLGEYVISSQHLINGTTSIKQDNKAYQVQASYVVTGEDNSFGAIKPLRNFDPLKGSWGALQLATRWSQLDVDNNTFTIVDPTKSASRAQAWTLGANWFLNSNALIRINYENVSFSGGAGTKNHITDRPNEQVFSTRFQLSF